MKAIITKVTGIDAAGRTEVSADVIDDEGEVVTPITVSGLATEIQNLIKEQLVLLQTQLEAANQLLVGVEIVI